MLYSQMKKVYDRIKQEEMWDVLYVYGQGGKLLDGGKKSL